VISSAEWHQDELDQVLSIYKEKYGKSKNLNKVKAKFEGWAKAVDMADDVFRALQTYYEVFFADEERRIMPALRKSLADAQTLSQSQDFPAIFEHISQGIRYSPDRFKGVDQVILAPSFWATPFIFYTGSLPLIFLFGARPDDASLVPGEVVPHVLMASLNAISDPTRLRILRYLSSESLTPTQLATRLRLRAPTVAHHIKALRTAGLITVIPGAHKKEVHYQTRTERLHLACEMLVKFISGQDDKEEA
jgi:DNA-binding transcriptional ArsR family regulator